MSTLRVRVALGLAAALVVGLLLGAVVARRGAPGPSLVRPMLGLAPAAPREALEPASAPVPADTTGPAAAPWRLGGDACRWLEAATGAPYADPRSDGWRRIDTCMRPEWRLGEILVHRGAWMHDPALAALDAKAVLEVQTYGGSVVEGYVDAELARLDSWPRRLEERLGSVPGLGSVRVRNYAMAGASSGPQLWRFRNEGLAEGPEIAVLYAGENDLGECRLFAPATDRLLDRWDGGAELDALPLHPWFRAHRAELAAARRRVLARRAEVDPALGTASVAAEVERARAEGRTPGRAVDAGAVEGSFLGEVPVEVLLAAPLLANVGDFVVTARAHGIVPVVVLPPFDWRDHPVLDTGCEAHGFTLEDRLAWFTRAVPRAMRAVAERHGAEVVDLPARLEDASLRRRFFVDNVHLSEVGMDDVVDLLEPIVRRHLEADAPAG